MQTIASSLSTFLIELYSAQAAGHSGASTRIRLDDPAIQHGKAQFFSVLLEFASLPAGKHRLTLDNLPWDEDVEAAASDIYGRSSETDRGRRLTLTITDKSHPKLRRLAQAIKRVVGRGKRYSDPMWKWTAPAIANTLVQLADHIRDYARSRRSAPPSTRGTDDLN